MKRLHVRDHDVQYNKDFQHRSTVDERRDPSQQSSNQKVHRLAHHEVYLRIAIVRTGKYDIGEDGNRQE